MIYHLEEKNIIKIILQIMIEKNRYDFERPYFAISHLWELDENGQRVVKLPVPEVR